MLHLLIRLDRKHGQKARTDEVRRAEKSWHLERVSLRVNMQVTSARHQRHFRSDSFAILHKSVVAALRSSRPQAGGTRSMTMG